MAAAADLRRRSGVGPSVQCGQVGRIAAVVRGQQDVGRRLGVWVPQQINKPQLLQVAGQQQVAAVMGDVEHEAAGVVRS